MKCLRVTKLYDAYHRGLLSERGNRQLEEHLSCCHACREVYEENETLVALIKDSSELPEVSPQYYQRLAARTIEQLNTPFGLGERLGAWWHGATQALRWRPLAQYATVGALCLLAGLALPQLLEEPAADVAQQSTADPNEQFVYLPQEKLIDETPPPNNSNLNISEFDELEAGQESALSNAISKETYLNNEANANRQRQQFALISLDAETLAAMGGAFGENFAKVMASSREQSAELAAQRAAAPQPPIVEATTIQSDAEWALTLNQIQPLKMELYQEDGLAQIRAIREIESLISKTQGNDEQLGLLSDYHRAEDAFLASDYFPAMQLYQQIVRQEPNSLLAALSSLQMANIRFELKDYANAFREYKECLDDKKFFTEDKHDWIMQRAQLLLDNEIDDYQPLRLFQLAESKTGAEALNACRQLLEQYPSSSLASQAVQRVSQLAIYGGGPDRIPAPVGSAIGILQRYALAVDNSIAAAQAQLAVSDITCFRLQNIKQARLEYGRIFEMTDDEEILTQVRNRLKQLSILETINN